MLILSFDVTAIDVLMLQQLLMMPMPLSFAIFFTAIRYFFDRRGRRQRVRC